MKNAFKDVNGNEWIANITVGTIRRVKEVLGVDLMTIVDQEKGEESLLARLHNDIELLVNVIFVVCKPQAETMKVSDEAFGELLATGDILEEAVDALIEGMMLFFPPRRRKVLQVMMDKYKEMEGIAADRIEREVANLDLNQIMDVALPPEISGALSPELPQ